MLSCIFLTIWFISKIQFELIKQCRTLKWAFVAAYFFKIVQVLNMWDFLFSLFCCTYWTECLVPSISCVKAAFPLIIVKTDVNEFMNKSSQGCKCWQVKICNKIWWSNTYFESEYTWSAVKKKEMAMFIFTLNHRQLLSSQQILSYRPEKGCKIYDII